MIAEKHFAKKDRLWTSSFLLLWQGQLFSGFGDRILQIALGFWVLAISDSTALMGILMALTGLPRLIIPPLIANTLEQMNKKLIMVLMNAIRGVFVIILGVAALVGYVQLWMVFMASMIINACGAFFNPVVKSSLPSIVPDRNLDKANSITDMIRAGTIIFGNFVGAVLFQILGASQMFLLNGISYLIAAFTGLLIKMPKVDEETIPLQAELKEPEAEPFFDEKLCELRYPLIIAAVINFLGNLGLILFLPLFQNTKGLTSGPHLNMLLAFGIVSTMLGVLFTLIVYIPPSRRLVIFVGANLLSGIGYSTWPLFKDAPLMLGIIFICGLFGAVYNVFITSNIQLTVPEKIRGKVFGLPGLIFPGLAPAAMVVGGILGEFIPIKIIIFASQMLILLMVIPLASKKMFKHFINFDSDTQRLEDIVNM